MQRYLFCRLTPKDEPCMRLQRYLFCRLVYHDNTPDEYEPQHFRSTDATELGHFTRKPFTM